MIDKLLRSLLGTPEEINGRERCPTYLYRWTVISTRWLRVYLHKFVGDDWSRDLHDHPKRFISIGLWGSYREERWLSTEAAEFSWSEIYRAPWVRTFPAEHIHRLSLLTKTCWTLVIVGQSTREWGFWHDGQFVQWREYVDSETADKRKACP